MMLVVVFLAGIIRGFAGFGSALLIVPTLAALYGPAQAVAIEVMIEIPVALGLLPSALRDAERRTVLPMLLMFLVFVPLGAILLNWTDPTIVKMVISIFVLAMVGVIAQQTRLAAFLSPRAAWGIGAISGLSQGMTAMAGPLFVTALLARGDSAKRVRANTILLAGGLISLAFVSFAWLGMITADTIAKAVLACPAMCLGVWAGSVAFRRLSHWNLRGVILVFLATAAIVTLTQAVMALWG